MANVVEDIFGIGSAPDPIPAPDEPAPLSTNARSLAIQRRDADRRRRSIASLRIDPVAPEVGVQVK